jgi:hypothetical protein
MTLKPRTDAMPVEKIWIEEFKGTYVDAAREINASGMACRLKALISNGNTTTAHFLVSSDLYDQLLEHNKMQHPDPVDALRQQVADQKKLIQQLQDRIVELTSAQTFELVGE